MFSHGWPLTADAWDDQLFLVASSGFRAIAHDRRGGGRSGQPWNGNDLDTYADDLAELIEALDLHDAILVGHSTGGGEVTRYIGRHGTSRVAKAVLLSAIPPLMLKTDANPGGLPIEVFDGLRANGVKLVLHRCKIACVARPGQQVVAGDRLADRIGIGVLARVFPPELVDRVVDEAGARERRTRTLPSRVVVYYLLAMVLFFQSGYGEVWNKLVAGLDWARRFRERLELGMQPSPAAITYARQRLGWQVMAALMEAVAGPLAGEEQERAFVAGMRLVAVDGMCLDLPATPENGAEFGYPGNDAGPGPFPQIRVVGLGECGTRAVLGAATSGLATGEQPLTRGLLGKLAPGDLLLADRNFLSHGLLADVLAAGVHVLWRAKSDVDLPVLQVLPDGTWLSRIADPAASRRLRRKGASGGDIPGITVRVIEYSVTTEDGSRDLGDLYPGHRHPRSRAADPAAGRRGLRLALAAGNLLRRAGNLDPGRCRGGAALEVPADDPAGDLRHALLLPGDPHPDQPRRRRCRDRPRPDLLHPRPRRNPQPHQRLRMLFPLTTSTTSPPTWPSR